MLAVTFATVPLVGIAEVMRALLNAKRTFVAPAAMSVVMNGLAALVVLASAGDIRRVAVAFVAGAAAQAVFMLVIAWWHGFRYQPSLRLNEAPLIALGRLSIRPSVGAGLNPVARIGEQLMLSFLPVGSISLQTYGYRLISAIGGTVVRSSGRCGSKPQRKWKWRSGPSSSSS